MLLGSRKMIKFGECINIGSHWLCRAWNLLCRPCWLQIHIDPPSSALWVLGLKAYMPSNTVFFIINPAILCLFICKIKKINIQKYYGVISIYSNHVVDFIVGFLMPFWLTVLILIYLIFASSFISIPSSILVELS